MSDSLHFSIGPLSDSASALVERYHYSSLVPSAVQCVGMFRKDGGLFGDKGEAVAAIFFTIPATRWSESVWELARLVRTDECAMPLSGLISRACRYIQRNRLIDLLVSFADPTHGHHGGVYQAASWNYHGQRDSRMDGVLFNGKFIAGRSANHRWGTQSPTRLAAKGVTVEPHYDEGKHLYWRALRPSGNLKAKRMGLTTSPYPKPSKLP